MVGRLQEKAAKSAEGGSKAHDLLYRCFLHDSAGTAPVVDSTRWSGFPAA